MLACATMHCIRANDRLSPTKQKEQICHLSSESKPKRCANPTTAKSATSCFSLLHCCSQDTEQVATKIRLKKKKCHLSLSSPPTLKHFNCLGPHQQQTKNLPDTMFSKIIWASSLLLLKSGAIPGRRFLNIWKTYHPV